MSAFAAPRSNHYYPAHQHAAHNDQVQAPGHGLADISDISQWLPAKPRGIDGLLVQAGAVLVRFGTRRARQSADQLRYQYANDERRRTLMAQRHSNLWM